MSERICSVDFDEAYYLGDEEDGVYFTAAKGDDGKWYSSTVVDCNTGGFTDALISDEGPFDSYADACDAAMGSALDWCTDNSVAVEDSDIDATRDAIHLDGTLEN